LHCTCPQSSLGALDSVENLLGAAVVGSAVVGAAVVGSAVVGAAVVGSAVAGAAVVGCGVTGAAVVGVGVAVRDSNRTRSAATQGSVAHQTKLVRVSWYCSLKSTDQTPVTAHITLRNLSQSL
jgi:hypothetical protein